MLTRQLVQKLARLTPDEYAFVEAQVDGLLTLFHGAPASPPAAPPGAWASTVFAPTDDDHVNAFLVQLDQQIDDFRRRPKP